MAKGVIYGNMATVLIQKGEFQQAEQFLLKSIYINSKKDFEIGDAQTAKIKLIMLYNNSGQNSKAAQLIKEMEEASPSVKNQMSSESILKFHYAKWKYYERIKNIPKAYSNLERYYFLKDSTETASKNDEYVDIEHGLRDADKAQLIELLKKDAQSKRLLITGAGIVIILIFTILFMVLRNLKRSRTNINKLSVSKKLIQNQYEQLTQVFKVLEKSHKENAVIMKVVAHDLRGPVSGMTNAAELMLSEEGLSESNHQMLNLVKEAGANALSLINEMLHTHHALGLN